MESKDGIDMSVVFFNMRVRFTQYIAFSSQVLKMAGPVAIAITHAQHIRITSYSVATRKKMKVLLPK